MLEAIIFIGIIVALLFIGRAQCKRKERANRQLMVLPPPPRPLTCTVPARNPEADLEQLFIKASNHYKASENDECLRTILAAYRLAREHALMDRPAVARLCNLRGILHQVAGEWRHALAQYQIAHSIMSKWAFGNWDERAASDDLVIAKNLRKAHEFLGW